MKSYTLIFVIFMLTKSTFSQISIDRSSYLRPNIKIAFGIFNSDTLDNWLDKQSGNNNHWNLAFINQLIVKVDTLFTFSKYPLTNNLPTVLKEIGTYSYIKDGYIINHIESDSGAYINNETYFNQICGDTCVFDYSQLPRKLYSYPFVLGSLAVNNGNYLSIKRKIIGTIYDSVYVKRYLETKIFAFAEGFLTLNSGTFQTLLLKEESRLTDSCFKKKGDSGNNELLFSTIGGYGYQYRFITKSFNSGIFEFDGIGSGWVVIDKNYPNGETENNFNINQILLFPNPCTNELSVINVEDKIMDIMNTYNIFDLSGKLLLFGSANDVINTSVLYAGIYFIQLKGEKWTKYLKFVKI